MHSTITRAQNVFGFFTTVAFVIAALIAASDLSAPRNPSSDIVVNNVQVVRGRPHYYSTKKEEYAHIRFSLDADLSSLFTWNTKQVFVYVTAVWPSNSTSDAEKGIPGDINEAVIWDTIITAPSSDHLSTIGPAALKKLRKSSKGKSIDPSRGILKLKNQKPKYQITSPKSKLAETENVELHVHYNVQPWVGVLTWTPQMDLGNWKMMMGGVSKAFNLPGLKKKDEASKGTTKSS